MRHSFIDEFAYKKDYFLQRLDARTKLITFFIFVLFIVFTPEREYTAFLFYASILFLFSLNSGVPLVYMLKRFALVTPFIILIAFSAIFLNHSADYIFFCFILIKALLSITCMVLLTSTTKFPELLKGMQALRVPAIFIMVMSFMYRYIFLIIDELHRILRAKESRSYGGEKKRRLFQVLSNVIGVLFLRSYERAERVYLAMCSRGFNGDIKVLEPGRIRLREVVFIGTTSLVLFLIRFYT